MIIRLFFIHLYHISSVHWGSEGTQLSSGPSAALHVWILTRPFLNPDYFILESFWRRVAAVLQIIRQALIMTLPPLCLTVWGAVSAGAEAVLGIQVKTLHFGLINP